MQSFTPQINHCRELTQDIIQFAPKENFKLPARPNREFQYDPRISIPCHPSGFGAPWMPPPFCSSMWFSRRKTNLKDSENGGEHQPPVQRINSPSMVAWCESLTSITYNRSGSSILLRSLIIWFRTGWCRPLFLGWFITGFNLLIRKILIRYFCKKVQRKCLLLKFLIPGQKSRMTIGSVK